MLRNNLIRQHSKVWYILNEVLSLNAQECLEDPEVRQLG